MILFDFQYRNLYEIEFSGTSSIGQEGPCWQRVEIESDSVWSQFQQLSYSSLLTNANTEKDVGVCFFLKKDTGNRSHKVRYTNELVIVYNCLLM